MMKKLALTVLLAGAAAILVACGGGDDDPLMAAATNATVPASAESVKAVAATPFTFSGGVAALGTTSTTTVSFAAPATGSPTFTVSTPTGSASGTMSFGSCIFRVTAVTGTVPSTMQVGQTITVNPCNINVATAGVVANGQGVSRAASLVLGAAASNGVTVTVAVNPGGQLVLNGTAVGTVTLTPVTG